MKKTIKDLFKLITAIATVAGILYVARDQIKAIIAKIKEVSDVACGSDAVSNILETYGYLIGEERKIIELANEAGDDVTADLMTGYLKEQEKMVWMLVAFSTKGCTDK